MKPNLKAIIFVSSLFIAFLLVKYSGNFVNGCPTSSLTPNTSADSPGCNLGFPLPYIMTGGFTGGGTLFPVFLIDMVIVAVVLYFISKFLVSKFFLKK